MTTLMIELPDNLAHQIHKRGISQQSLKDLFIGGLEVFLRKEVNSSTLPIDEALSYQKVANHRDVFEPTGQVYCYPTVSVPLSSLEGLIGIMPGIKGDALADTEALLDEV
ncbi:MAG: hypothetical protein VSS75_033910 [Candidatus Parabeggiatoa sp.]|nr:hypothetical protein [Candidatus Parabeggiatoa sp.]